MFAAIVGQSWAIAAHPFNLEVNGTDLIASVRYGSVRIEMPGPGSNGSMTFTLTDTTNAITISKWDEVRFIEHAATRPILFGGFVQSRRFIVKPGIAGREIAVICVGYGILLDKKVVAGFHADTTLPVRVADNVTSIVNRWGGIVTALNAGYTGGGGTQVNETVSVANPGNQWNILGTWYTLAGVDVPVGYLRSVLEFLFANSQWSIGRPITGLHWVDSARRLCAVFDLDPGDVTGSDPRENLRFTDAVPGFQLDLSGGAYSVTDAEYEDEDTDRATSAYVSGTGTPGTGYYRTPALERTGDLETLVSDTTSTDPTDVQSRGMAAVSATTSATARGSSTLYSPTPLDVWPGREIDVTSTQLGLTSTTQFRITSVVVSFYGAAGKRSYALSWGGSLGQPSAMRRVGRFQTRSR